ncbi:MAG: response regulator [Roseburia sp.]
MKKDDKTMTNIAIIEDDKGLNNGIALALKNEEYHFAQYYSLEEAKKDKLDRGTDLIILDINLPDGNGFDYLRELR